MSDSRRTEWSVELRTSISFRVNDQAVQALLPAGWQVAPSAAPPDRGANLTLTFMERLLVLDGEEQTKRTGTSRYLVVSTPGRSLETGTVGAMIVGGISPEGAGVYDAYRLATEARVERSSSSSMEEFGAAHESWLLAAGSGERVALRLRFRRGLLVKSQVDVVIRSAVHSEFTRTYHIDQARDVLRSQTTADRIDEIHFEATGRMFDSLFDGSEQLLAVVSIPSYVRAVDVP